MVFNIVKDSKSTFPWITRDIINKSLQKYRKECVNNIQEAANTIVNIRSSNRQVQSITENKVANILTDLFFSNITISNISNQLKGG